MKFARYDRPYQEFPIWSELCPPDEWRRLSPEDFGGILPEGLLAKANAVLVLSSDAGGSVTYVADILRVDAPASVIDQEPYVLRFDHAASAVSGYFVHHGNWPGRSVRPGSSFFQQVASSGIEHHYPYSFIPPGSAGPMSQIRAHPQADTYWRQMKSVRKQHSSRKP